jgi:hypothetical protein
MKMSEGQIVYIVFEVWEYEYSHVKLVTLSKEKAEQFRDDNNKILKSKGHDPNTYYYEIEEHPLDN